MDAHHPRDGASPGAAAPRARGLFAWIVRTSLQQRLFVLALAVVLMGLGVFTASRTPVDVFPDLNRPTVTVMTEAGGLAPEEVEPLVTQPLEAALGGMPGVVRVRSVSGVGLSVVYAEFDWGSDTWRNRQLVAERLTAVAPQLPAGVVPHMGPVSSVMGEILLVTLPLAGPGQAMPAREWVDFVLRPRLLAVPGVAQVIPIGGEVRQLRIEPDLARLAQWRVSLPALQQALQGFAANAGGGFLVQGPRELLVRHLGRSGAAGDLERRLAELRALPVPSEGGGSVPLAQLAEVRFAAAVPRGDAGYEGQPAIVVSVQKQPQADTLAVTREVEAALAALAKARPAGVAAPVVSFRQADFIAASVRNVQEALRDGAILVAVVLFAFLLNTRTTLISLTAIPLSLALTALVFHLLGLSINVMTLGGLAIAVGELVDDALVDVENVLRRLRQARAAGPLTPPALLRVVAAASNEVRSGVVLATAVVVLVFVPLFALPGIEGRLFTPLGVAYITAILASLLVALTVTPVLCHLLLPGLKDLRELSPAVPGVARGDSPLVRVLKAANRRALLAALPHARAVLALAALAVLAAAATVPLFPRTFLPPFNEGSLTVTVQLQPGTSLAESRRLGAWAEQALARVPEVEHVGRRSGRAELDEHAEGVHVSELEIGLHPLKRPLQAVMADIRTALAPLPASVAVGQPIAHRLDHLLSGVRAPIALKVFGDELDLLRGTAEQLRERLAAVPGLADLQVEKQVLVPQLTVRVDPARAAAWGVAPGELLAQLRLLTEGQTVAQVVDGTRRFDVVLRLADAGRDAAALAAMPVATPRGRVPLGQLAEVHEDDGPNQIGRENGRRRIVVQAYAEGGQLSAAVAGIREVLRSTPLPAGTFVSLEGQFQAQEEAMRRIAVLATVSLALIFLVLYGRYRSATLVAMIMASIPMALVGSVAALWLAGLTLSVASLVGFVTLTGIATRNGILKISHFINLARHEGLAFGPELVLRGTLERMTPVLMTALVAALALVPLLLSAEAPGKEILHPVAVVIFGGLVSSTLLDALLTPLMFWLWGRRPLERLLAEGDADEIA